MDARRLAARTLDACPIAEPRTCEAFGHLTACGVGDAQEQDAGHSASSGVAKYRRCNHSETCTRPISVGTSTSGPMIAANAASLWIPKVPIATASASSKLFDAAVNERVALCSYVAPLRLLMANDTANMIAKYTNNGAAIRNTSSGRLTIASPLSENITMIVNSSATSVIGPIRGTNLR